MRSYIFTDRERRLLREWLEEDVESRETVKLFTRIRAYTPGLREDLRLMLRVMRELQKRRRWHGYDTKGTGFGSALRRARSALTRLKNGGATSDASRG